MTTEINNRARWLQGPSAECSVPPVATNLPWRLILLGAPGVGKGTQADFLTHRLRACHLSTGDVFRTAARRCDCNQSPAMKEAQSYMRRGALVPDLIVWKMVRERSACLNCRGGFILDGFPRTLAQAQALKQHLEKEHLAISAVIDYELPEEEIIKRLSGRRTCENCGAVFHLTSHPPKQKDICDQCSGKLYQREDDRPESVKVRLQAYHDSTAPLLAFYRNLGLLASVPADGAPEDIFNRTIAALTGGKAA